MSRRSPLSRLTLRARFALLTGVSVLVACAVLLTGAYLLTERTLTRMNTAGRVIEPAWASYGQDCAAQRMGSGNPGHFNPDSILCLSDGTTITGSEYKARAIKEVDRQEAVRLGQRDAALRLFVWLGALILCGVGVFATTTSWIMTGRLLRPLRAMTRTTRQIADSPGRLGRRVALDGPDDEVLAMATAFDTMLERLDRAFDTQRRFVSNASHELRTPLAINRALIEVALEESDVPAPTVTLCNTLLAVNVRNERLIEAMLTLATSEQELSEHTPLDLADVAAFVIDDVRTQSAAADVLVRLEPGPAPVTGDPILLERLTANLVTNAIRHNQPGGWVTVTTAVQDHTATLEVSNSGQFVPPHQAEALFEPFRRVGDAGRVTGQPGDGGFGLGLSIVRAIANAHGGEARLAPRAEGGLTVRISIPVAGPPAATRSNRPS